MSFCNTPARFKGIYGIHFLIYYVILSKVESDITVNSCEDTSNHAYILSGISMCYRHFKNCHYECDNKSHYESHYSNYKHHYQPP